MSVTFDDLGDDVVEIIIGYVKHYNSLASLKMTCLRTNNHISRYSIAKLMLSSRLGLFSFCELCINDNCYEDSYRAFKFHHRFNSRYIHHRQNALNTTAIIVNEKYYNINSHYCCECFKEFVLVGSNECATVVYPYFPPYQQVQVIFI